MQLERDAEPGDVGRLEGFSRLSRLGFILTQPKLSIDRRLTCEEEAPGCSSTALASCGSWENARAHRRLAENFPRQGSSSASFFLAHLEHLWIRRECSTCSPPHPTFVSPPPSSSFSQASEGRKTANDRAPTASSSTPAELPQTPNKFPRVDLSVGACDSDESRRSGARVQRDEPGQAG